MIEIRQANYNPDELSWEVIESIVDLARQRGSGRLVGLRGVLYDADRSLFEAVVNGDDSNKTRDEWLGAEEDWRAWGAKFNIEVYDDGEAGWTYVGSSEEIAEFQDKQEADL